MKKSILVSVLLVGLLAFTGCTTASRVSVAKDGTQTTSKVSTFLTTATGFSDTVSTPDGVVSQTTLANYASDVQAIIALGNIVNNLASKMLMAGNTNLIGNTNFLATLAPSK